MNVLYVGIYTEIHTTQWHRVTVNLINISYTRVEILYFLHLPQPRVIILLQSNFTWLSDCQTVINALVSCRLVCLMHANIIASTERLVPVTDDTSSNGTNANHNILLPYDLFIRNITSILFLGKWKRQALSKGRITP